MCLFVIGEYHQNLFVSTWSAVVGPIHVQESTFIRDHRHEFGLEDEYVFYDLLRTAVRYLSSAEVTPACSHQTETDV